MHLTKFPPAINYLACPTFQMVAVPGGTFMMGGDKYDREKPIHKVTIADFAMGEFPVTQEVWELVMQGTDTMLLSLSV